MQSSSVRKIIDGIYSIRVPMPDYRPTSVNAYLIKGEPKSLLIDPGLDLDICEKILRAGLAELDISLDSADLLITHSHGDHAGMLYRLAKSDTNVYLNAFLLEHKGSYRKYIEQLSHSVELSAQTTYDADISPNRVYPFLISRISAPPVGGIHKYCHNGDTLSYGGREYIYLTTPGHCEDHCCLFSPQDGILISGDIILANTYPAVSDFKIKDWHLVEYFESLKKIEDLDVNLICPGHGAGFDLKPRCLKTREYHFQRLCSTVELIQTEALTASEIAQRLNRRHHGRSWSSLLPYQRFTAVAENLAYINFLCECGMASSRSSSDNMLRYTCADYDKERLRHLCFALDM